MNPTTTTTRKFTFKQLCECAERELRLRRRVYPNRIETGRMKQADARRQIEMMEAILEILTAEAVQERLL